MGWVHFGGKGPFAGRGGRGARSMHQRITQNRGLQVLRSGVELSGGSRKGRRQRFNAAQYGQSIFGGQGWLRQSSVKESKYSKQVPALPDHDASAERRRVRLRASPVIWAAGQCR